MSQLVRADVYAERAKQDAKWGEQNKQPLEWCAIIGEEYGEVCQETVELFKGNKAETFDYYKELCHLAATVICAMEDYRRHEVLTDH